MGASASEPPAQPQLGGPRSRHDPGVQALLTPGELGADTGSVLVGSGRLDQPGAQLEVAGLVRWPRRVVVPLEDSFGTSPQKPMNALALAKRRQPPTSAANCRAPRRVTPR